MKKKKLKLFSKEISRHFASRKSLFVPLIFESISSQTFMYIERTRDVVRMQIPKQHARDLPFQDSGAESEFPRSSR